MARNEYLGYRDGDRNTPYGGFFQPEMAPLPRHVVDALEQGPQAGPALLARDEASTLLDDAYHQTENGYGLLRDGSIGVSVRTDMPGVTPAMWVWWFGWHGCDARRYKLWHPRAHVYAQWSDGADAGRRGVERYVDRTSLIGEYLGSTYVRAAIRFVRPAVLGLDETRLTDTEVAVCARIGPSDLPVDAGWFVHHIRATADGSEMRSRFWVGGPHLVLRSENRLGSAIVRPLAARRLGVSASAARDLMVHCAAEMNHLAGFLATLHDRLGDD